MKINRCTIGLVFCEFKNAVWCESRYKDFHTKELLKYNAFMYPTWYGPALWLPSTDDIIYRLPRK